MLSALCLSTAALTVAADFGVTEIQARYVEDTLQFTGGFDLGLTPKVEEALSKGIPIELILGVRLYRERPYIWDKKTAEWTRRRQIRYHALSGQYLVGELSDCLSATGTDCSDGAGDSVRPPVKESFHSLTEALKQLGSLSELKLRLPPALLQDTGYSVTLRVFLDIEALPAPLRPVAYTSPDWHLNSGWTSWTVQH